MSTPQLSLSLFGEPRPNELIWGWLGRFRERYEGVSHDALGEIIGELPSYRKLFPTRLEHLAAVTGIAPDAHQQEFEADDWAATTATQPMELEHCRANLCVIPLCLGVIAGVNWRATKYHPAMSARLLRIYRNHIVPKTAGDGSFFNTALFAVMTPLQALLFLRGISPDQLKVANDLDDFLPWWEAKMVELGA